MGEIISYKGKEVKLGTCEDLYYVSYQKYIQAMPHLSQVEYNESPADYAKDNSGFRFRFPFPDEDCLQFGEVEDYERGYLLSVPKEMLEDVNHDDKYIHYDCQDSHKITMKVPCPAAKDSSPIYRQVQSTPLLLKQQRLIDGKLWAIFECGYCGSRFRVDEEEARKYAEYIPDEEIRNRMLVGYKLEVTK